VALFHYDHPVSQMMVAPGIGGIIEDDGKSQRQKSGNFKVISQTQLSNHIHLPGGPSERGGICAVLPTLLRADGNGEPDGM
jgi:hypothetical protein